MQGVDTRRYVVVPRTLVFIRHAGDVLLLHRSQRRSVWPGRLNGVGGHVEAGESLSAAALREVAEETGLTVRDVRFEGLLHVTDLDAVSGVMVAVFSAHSDVRYTRASQEGRLMWVAIDRVLGGELGNDLVSDLACLLPRLWRGVAGAPFLATSPHTGEVVFSD